MKYAEKYLAGTIVALIFASLLTPFIITKSLYFPYVAGKGFYFRIIVEIILVAYLFLVVKNPDYRPVKNITIYILSALGISLIISNLLGPNSYKSFFSNYERMEGFINIAHLIIFFVVSHSVLKTKKLWDYLFGFSLFVSICVYAYVLLQLAGKIAINQGGVRVDGPFGNAAYLAMYALIHVFLALYFLIQRRFNVGTKILFGIIAIANIHTLYSTETRGAMLGLLGGLLLSAIIISIFNKIVAIRYSAIGIFVLLAVIIFGVWSNRDSDFVKNSSTLSRLTSISLSDSTTVSRFTIWGMAIEGIKERPVFGWGQENFNYVFNTFYKPSLYAQEEWFDRSHNLVLDWVVAGGIVGGFLYLSLFPLLIWYIWRKEELELGEKAVLTGLVSGYFFQNLFVFDNPTSYALFFLLIAYLTPYNREDIADTSEKKDFNLSEKINVLVPISIFAIIVVYASFVFTVKPILAGTTLIGSLQEYGNYGTYTRVLSEIKSSQGGLTATRSQIPIILKNPEAPIGFKNIFRKFEKGNGKDLLIDIIDHARLESANNVYYGLEKVINLKTFGTFEAREQISQLAINVIRDENFPKEIGEKIYDLARREIDSHVASAPFDARNEIMAGLFYAQSGSLELALEHSKMAQVLSPKKQKILLQIGSIYMSMGKTEEAISSWKDAFDLDERNNFAGITYAGGLIASEKSKEGKLILEKIVNPIQKLGESEYFFNNRKIEGETAVYTNQQLVNIYSHIKDYKSLIETFLWRIEKDPENPDNKLALALAYFDNNEKTKANKVIEEMILMYPDFAETGKKYITEIKAGRRPQ